MRRRLEGEKVVGNGLAVGSSGFYEQRRTHERVIAGEPRHPRLDGTAMGGLFERSCPRFDFIERQPIELPQGSGKLGRQGSKHVSLGDAARSFVLDPQRFERAVLPSESEQLVLLAHSTSLSIFAARMKSFVESPSMACVKMVKSTLL